MRTSIFSILFLFIFAFFATAATTPIKNGFLQSDFNGNQFSITNLKSMTVGTLTASNLNIFGTNSGVSDFVSLPMTNHNNLWDRFPFANTNNPSTNFTIRYDSLVSELASVISPSFPWLIVTNGSSTATIQSQFNSLTSGGVVAFQPGNYSITASLSITNPMIIFGDGATLSYNSSLTNIMLDTGTNYAKGLVIDNLRFDGGTYGTFNQSNYYQVTLRGGSYDPNPYFNTGWTNRTALRVECSGGVVINNCYFYGWAGNATLFTSIQGGAQFRYPKLLFLNNRVYTNFVGVMLACTAEDTQGYYNASTVGVAGWSAEYCMLAQNDIFDNYIGVSASPGNCVIENNFIDENWIALVQVSNNGNQTHGRYNNNSFNHNNFAIWSWLQPANGEFLNNFFGRNGQALGPFQTNIIWPNGSISGIHFDNSQGIMFNNNKMSREWLTFTNGCLGTFAHNTYGGFNYGLMGGSIIGDSNVVWGVDVPTNFNAGMLIYDNHENLGLRHDGSMGSVLSVATNTIGFGSLAFTPDRTNAAWTTQIQVTTNGSLSSSTNSIIPSPVTGQVIWWYSNYDGWIITPTKTNRVFQGQ